MPMIDLTLSKGALSPEVTTQLVDELTTILLTWEGGAGNPQAASLAWAYLHEADFHG